ncbi:MAG: DNA-binding protein [Acidobacteria bacterium]|nr:DNA-binding protein [Acidobacteriota bacterium]
MRYLKAGGSYVVRLETGEEIFSSVVRFAADRRIDAASITGIGAAYDLVLGYYDRANQEYLRRSVPDEVEIVSLVGNLAIKEGQPFPHVHVALGTREFQALAGHLFEGKVAGTCELVIRPLDGFMQRTKDDRSGLFLLDL